MKKILFVSHGMGLGGTEKTLVSALNALDYTKYDITLYLRKNITYLLPSINKSVKVIVNDNPPVFENYPYCKICYIGAGLSKILKLKSLSHKFSRSAKKYISRKRAEYEKATFFENSEYDYAVAYDMGIDVVKFTLDYVEAKSKIGFFHLSGLHATKMLLYKEFNTIACVNDLVAENMKLDYPQLANKIVAVENFIAPDFVRNSINDNTPLTKPNNKLVLCSCGRIAKVKGFDMAVKAAKILKDKGIDFHWFFVGNYLDDGFVENLIEKEKLEQEITVTGFVSNPYKYMKICDIYVQPSYEEAHGLTVAEAIIIEKPIINTNTFSGQLFGDKYGCCNVCDKNADALADAILNLYNNPAESQRLIKATKKFNYSDQYEEYKKALNSLFL